MQSASFLGLIAVLVASLIPQLEANRCAGIADGTFINDFTECDAFFTCVRGSAVPGRCPTGFYFNEQGQLCDNPWNVICLLCVSGSEPEPEPEPVAGVRSFEQFPIEDECRKYTFCVNGIGFLRECATGLMFDPVAQQCDLEANVDCTEGMCPNDINPSVATFVPDPFDCARYYICFQGQVMGEGSQPCAGDLLFNPETRQCDLPDNVECEVLEPPVQTTCPPTGIVNIPEEGSCNTHFTCVNGDKFGPIDCAPGLIFDINSMLCRPRTEDPPTKCITDEPAEV